MALKEIGIKNRLIKWQNEVIYFCYLPNGSIFNLQIDETEIKVWKFIGLMSSDKVQKRYELICHRLPHLNIGYEITDEEDLSIYISMENDSENEISYKDIRNLIVCFIKMLNFSVPIRQV